MRITGYPWQSRLTHDGVVPLAQPEVHIGLLAANDIVLSDPGASRVHAVIRWTPAGYELDDLGSTTGTYVQGWRIPGRALLTPGVTMRIGGTELYFEALPVPDANSPAMVLRQGAVLRNEQRGKSTDAVNAYTSQEVREIPDAPSAVVKPSAAGCESPTATGNAGGVTGTTATGCAPMPPWVSPCVCLVCFCHQ